MLTIYNDPASPLQVQITPGNISLTELQRSETSVNSEMTLSLKFTLESALPQQSKLIIQLPFDEIQRNEAKNLSLLKIIGESDEQPLTPFTYVKKEAEKLYEFILTEWCTQQAIPPLSNCPENSTLHLKISGFKNPPFIKTTTKNPIKIETKPSNLQGTYDNLKAEPPFSPSLTPFNLENVRFSRQGSTIVGGSSSYTIVMTCSDYMVSNSGNLRVYFPKYTALKSQNQEI